VYLSKAGYARRVTTLALRKRRGNPSKIRLTTEVTETRRSEKDEVWQIC